MVESNYYKPKYFITSKEVQKLKELSKILRDAPYAART